MKSIQIIHRKLLDRLGSVKNATVLDYGCGKGGVIKLLTQEEAQCPSLIYAIDSDHQAINNIEEAYFDEIKKAELRHKLLMIHHNLYMISLIE